MFMEIQIKEKRKVTEKVRNNFPVTNSKGLRGVINKAKRVSLVFSWTIRESVRKVPVT